MARPRNIRSGYNLGVLRAQGPGVQVDPVVLYHPPRGINSVAGVSYVPNEYCRFMANLMFDRGKLRSRLGTEQLGGPGPEQLMAVFSFTTPGGEAGLFRATTNKFQLFNGDDWTSEITALAGGPDDYITWTGWNDKVLLSNGVTKIFWYDVVQGTRGQIAESFPCKHLTSFGNRVIASAVTRGTFKGNQVAWSVKNNSDDWTSQTTLDGIGAGYEDLLGSPEGHVDEVMGVFPITDEVALMVREFSIWQMSLTGNYDSPFRFSRITPKVGARSRGSIANTPFGVVFATRNDIVLATPSGYESISEGVRDRFFADVNAQDFHRIQAAYDPRRQEYRIANGNQVWRYSFLDKGWSRDIYSYPIKQMSYVSYDALGLIWDAVNSPGEGTWDEQILSWDEMTQQTADEAMHFIDITDNAVTRERGVVIGPDEDPIAAPSTDLGENVPFFIDSGTMRAGSHLDKTMVIELQLEYESLIAQTIVFEYSPDQTGWLEYVTTEIGPTLEPTLLRVRKTLERKNIAFRIRSPQLGKLLIHSFTPFLVVGGRMNW